MDANWLAKWGPALVVSVALHVVVLGTLVCTKGCESRPPAPPPVAPQTDGRATDLPETPGAKNEDVEDPPPVQPAKTAAKKVAPAKTAAKKVAPAKAEPKKPVPVKTEPKNPENRKTAPVSAKVEPKTAESARPAAAKDADAASKDAEVWRPYKVKPGESLTKIARTCGCTLQELAKANGLSVTANLQVGQTIKVKSTPVEE